MVDTTLLKKRKKELGLSFDDIAEKTGCSRRAIIGIINGETLYPRMETVQALAKVLYLNTEDISSPDFLPPQQPVSTPAPSDEYTDAEKRVIAAYRTLVPGMQDYILEMIEKLADVDTGENKGKKVNRA